MLYCHPSKIIPVQDVNLELAKLIGELDDETAKRTLAQFLYRNLGFTTELMTGIKLYPDQIVNLKGMLESDYSLCVLSRGLGKCNLFNEQTQVLTKEYGLISVVQLIQNINFSIPEHWITIPTINLWNGFKWVEVNKILTQPLIPSTKITTNCGYTLSGSTRHLVKVWDKQKLEIVWKRYDDITTDDYICIARNNYNNNELQVHNKEIDEAYLIGLLIGDGSLTDSHFQLTSSDEELLLFLENNYPVGKRIYDKRSKAININIKTLFSRYLKEKYNLKCSLSYDKEIPQYILKNKELTKACLQGLMDTDGSAYSNVLTVQFCSTSEKLARQVHNLLNLFGIISKLRMKKTKSTFGKAWTVDIFGKNVVKFHDRIGFRLTRKNDNIKNLLYKKLNTNKDVIPGIMKYTKSIFKKYKFSKELNREWNIKYNTKEQFNFSYDKLTKCTDFFKRSSVVSKDDIEKLDNIINENFYFDKVQSIEQLGQQNCIDFNVPDGEQYWSNGFISHNTSLAAIFAVLLCIFKPKTNILIAGPTFRTSRFIFNYIEKMCEQPEAKMLFACMGKPSKRNDEFYWGINGGGICAIPLNGEKIRGFRANVLIIDEFLLMNEDLVEKVLIPYLIVPQDLKKRQKVRERENKLVEAGVMTDAQRTKFVNNAKMIGLSSASFQCEYLYRKYMQYIDAIYSPKGEEDDGRYFISQMAWDGIPEETIGDRIDKKIITLAQSNQANMASFRREYGAEFVNGSDGFYSMNKMLACSVPDGEEPTLLLRGAKDKKYIMAIDPNWSNSETSDHFAMCVMELEDKGDNKFVGTIVHQYARAGNDLKDHIAYFHYIMTNFNIELIIIDNSGFQFIDSANESEAFKNSNINLKIFDFAAEKDGADYDQQIKNAQRDYNKTIQRIVFTQVFNTEFIGKGNEWLQGCIDFKWIWFGASIKSNPDAFERAINVKVNENLVDSKLDQGESFMGYFIDNQENLIKQTRYQCAAIELKTTARGTQSFDLSNQLKRDRSASKMRRDSYTALMLAAWAVKIYGEISNKPVESNYSFEPFAV